MCGFVINILKYEKEGKKKRKRKKPTLATALQNTRHQIAIFVFDWLIIVFWPITDQGHGKPGNIRLFLGSINVINSTVYDK